MRTFAINQHNDLVIDAKGDLQICDNDEAVKNLCQHFIKAVRGEMLHKKDKGIPYWSATFSRQVDIPLFEMSFRQRLAEIEEVVAISHFNAFLDNGVLKYQADIRTIYGGFTLHG
ncbi:TPA: hypothetical protein JD649_RS16400 [Proteus mirabilis]|nr:hypothetical protein [Proteus mirabilis]HCD1103814.1 hypothetical protein [Proteus mirabilis]HCD1125758.1 hypothetical protein [Proteus mirabilis]